MTDKTVVIDYEFEVVEGKEEQLAEAIKKMVSNLNDSSYRGSGFIAPIKDYKEY